MLSFKIAYRFLINKKSQTLLIAMAVAIGISIQIFLGMLIQNLQNDLINTTIGTTSHITVKAKNNEIIQNGSNVLNEVKGTDNKIVTAIQVLDRPGILSNNSKSTAVLLRGFDINQANKIYKFNNDVVSGALPTGNNEVAIGKLLAEDLGVSRGDTISLLTPNNKVVEVKVTGLLDLKADALNKSYVVSQINSLRNIYGLEKDDITSIETQVDNSNIFLADSIGNEVQKVVGSNLVVSNWISSNQSLLSALKGQSSSSYTIQVFIVLSVLVAIASILAINVLQKTKQIGILKAMGITDRKASLIFIFQGALIGIFGAIIGSGLGVALFKIFTVAVKNSDGTPLISGGINGNFIILSLLIAVGACIISSIVPAIKTLRLNPVEAIKS